MAEKIKQTESQTRTVEEEYFFEDDPRRYDAYREQAEKKLGTILASFSQEDLIDFIETEVIKNQCQGQVLTALLEIPDGATDNYPSLVFTTIFKNQRIWEAINRHPRLAELEAKLLPIIRDQLTYAVDIGRMAINGRQVTLVAADQCNYLSAWYIDQTFGNLEQTVANLKSVADTEEREQEALSLAILGYLFGKFNPDNPYAATNRRAIAPFLPDNIPSVLRNHIPPAETVENETKRLQLLKSFWHEAFVTSFISAKRVNQTTSATLNPADLLRAQQKLPRDTQVAEMRSGAQKMAETSYAKTGNLGAAQNIVHEYDRESQKAEQVAAHQKKKLLTFLNQILTSYNGQHRQLVDDAGRPVDQWNIFRSKCGRLFEVCAQSTSRLHAKDISPAEVESILATTRDQLVTVLQTGNGTNVLEPSQLFGPDFSRLEPIEAVSLVIFSALAIAKPSDRPEQTIRLFSYQLQHILNKHQLKTNYPLPSARTLPITDAYYGKQAAAAVNSLFKLRPSDELVSVYDTEVATRLSSRTEVLDEYKSILKVAKQVAEGSPHLKIKTLRYVLLSAIATLMFFAGGNTGEILTGEPLISPLGMLTNQMAMLGVGGFYYFLSLATANVQPRNAVELKQTLKEIEITGNEFYEGLRKVKGLETLQMAKARAALALAMLISLASGLGLKIADELDMLDPVVDAIATHFSTETPPPVIGVNLSPSESFIRRFPQTFPEEIDYSNQENTPTVKLAEILHLPTNLHFEDGDPVLFLPRQSANRYDIPTFTSIQPFQEIKPFTSDEQIAEDALDHEYAYAMEMSDPWQLIYPPDGHRIVRLYVDTTSSDANIDTLGRVRLRDVGKRVVVVTEPLPQQTHDAYSEVVEYSGPLVTISQPWENWPEKYQQALNLNHELSPDVELQNLHMQMITEINELFKMFEAGQLGEDVMRDVWSDIALNYTVRLSDYLQRTRTYSLRPMQLNNDHPYTALIEIASEPNLGYACTVANLAYAEFMASINVQVLSKSGYVAYKFQDGLYGQNGHLNSLLYLPKGPVINVDLTPNRPTPGEDLSSQKFRPPKTEEEKQDHKSRVLQNLGLFTAALAGAGVVGYGVKKYRSRPIWLEFQEQLNAMTPEQNQVSEAVVSAAEHILVYLLYTADEQTWERSGLTSHFESQDQFRKSLTDDTLTFLKPENIRPFDSTSIDSSPARISHRYLHEVSKMDHQQKIKIRDGIKLIRRELQSQKHGPPEQILFIKSLSKLLKNILVQTR